MPDYLLSIVIPAFNGQRRIGSLLESLIADISEAGLGSKVSIDVTDDCSTDRTVDIIKQIASKNPQVKLYQNPHNLGMDGNFLQSALNARGKFIWFSGQDDMFLTGAVSSVVKILSTNSSTSLVYLNYSQVLEKDLKETEIVASMFDFESSLKKPLPHVIKYSTSHEFLQDFNDFPSFLPATVIRRSFMKAESYESFMGTHFIQYAATALNAGRGPIYVLTQPLIRGRIPKNGWQKNGDYLFAVMTGKIKATKMVYENPSNPFSPAHFQKLLRDFYLLWPKLLIQSIYLGLKPNSKNYKDLSYIAGNKYFYCLYFALPLKVMEIGQKLIQPIRSVFFEK